MIEQIATTVNSLTLLRTEAELLDSHQLRLILNDISGRDHGGNLIAIQTKTDRSAGFALES